MKIFFAIMAVAFLIPTATAIGDMTCWFWLGSQCSNLVWDSDRTLIACISFSIAIPCIGVWIA
jgi:hypothetical protein